MKKLTLSLTLVLLGVLLSCSDMFAASQQARYIFMQSITSNSATAKWLYNGDGAGRIVVLRADNNWAATETALNSTTSNFADAAGALGAAPEIGATGSFVVDVHTGTTKQIGLTGLASGTTYWIRIFEWDEAAGVYAYFTTSGCCNNPRSFVTLTAVPQPPTLITVDAGNCDFDIEWTPGANAPGTIMSLFYDESDFDICDEVPTGVLGTFSITPGDTGDTEWIDIDLGDLTSIEGFPIEFFNHDHLVRMWGYNGNVDNVSSTFTDEMFTPIEDCDGPVATIIVRHLTLVEDEWVVGDLVAEDECTVGGRYRVYINWSEPIEDFDETDIILFGATMVEGTWSAGETNEEFEFDIETELLVGDVGISINGLFADCVGNTGGSGEYNIPPLDLLSTENFSVLAGYEITGIAPIVITGDVGLSPETGANITGFSGVDVAGTIYTVDAAGPAGSVPAATLLTAAKNDLTTAYNDAAGRTPIPTGTFLNPNAGTSELNGQTLVPGLYKFDATALISGDITLDAGSNPNSVWIFQIGTQLTVDNDVDIILAGGADARNIFWQVGSLAALGTGVTFNGTILANNAITINTGSTVNGRILARLAEVTMASGVSVFHPGSLPFDFAFSVDNVAPVFVNETPEFTDEGQETCISVNNWDFTGFPGVPPVNTPANVPIEIGFDVFDVGCCGDATPTVNVQVWDPEANEGAGDWVFVAELTTGANGYDYLATFTVTSDTPDGDYQFEVILTDCNENMTSWTGLPFSVDNTPPEGYPVDCVTEIIEEVPVTTCLPVEEWEAPCLGLGEEITLCTAVIEEGCGTFNVESVAFPPVVGLGLFMDPLPTDFTISDVSGTGTVEDPYIVCVTITVTSDDEEGSYAIGVWGYDEAGNFNFQVDSDAFSIDLTAPVIDEDPLEACYGDDSYIFFTFSAEDIDGCSPLTVTAVWTFADATTLGMSLSVEEPFYSFEYTAMSGVTPEGPATLTLTATDGAGNETVVEQFTTFDFIDPALVGEIMWPEDNCLSEGQQFCVEFTLEDLGCGLDELSAEVNWAPSSIAVNLGSEEGTWDISVCFDITTEASGSYPFIFGISDYAGNGFLINETSAFTIDNTDPVVTNMMIDDDCVTTTDVVTITFNASDAFSCCTIDSFFDVYVTLEFADLATGSATFVSAVVNTDGGWDYTFTYTILPTDEEGPVLVVATAVDCADNEGTTDIGFQIDRTAPVVSELLVDPNDCVAPGVDIVMTFNAEDADGCGVLDCDAAWAVLTFSNSTTVMVDFVTSVNCTTVIAGPTAYTAWYTVLSGDPAGAVSVAVYVQDGAGNIGSQSLINAVTIDNVAPVVENITVDETCVTESDIVTICFDASDLGCGSFDDANLDVVVWFGEMSWSATYSSDFEGNYCYTFAISGSETHPSGFYDVAVTATDEAGNETSLALEGAFQVVHAPVMAEWTVDYNVDCEVTNANPICFEFAFDREVFGFTTDDVSVDFGWEVSSVVNTEGNSWMVCVSALSASGTGTFYMDVSGVYDCADNEYMAFEISAGYDYDAPSGYTASFADDEGNPIDYINAESCDDIYITITGGVVGETANWLIEVGEITYDGFFVITTSPETFYLEGLELCEDEEGLVNLTVTLSDCAGNIGEEATDDVILDVTGPCVVIDAPSHVNDDFEASFTWTEDVMGFDVSDLVVTNGTTFDFAGSGADYTVGIVPTTEGLVMIEILSVGHGITDLAGNPFNPEQEDCYEPAETNYDITPPVFDDLVWNITNEELTIWWNEAVMGGSPVDLADLELTFVQNGGTATGATLTGVTHTEGNFYAYVTIEVEGTPNGCELIEFRPTDGASVFDLAGNAQDETNVISINLVNFSFPTVQASDGFADNVYASQAQLNWTRGDGDAVIVILFEDNDCNVDPVNGVNYEANSYFGLGDFLACSDSEGGSVVYYGTGTQVTVDYLTGCTNYRAVVYEVNGGECDNPNYLTPGHSFEFETAPVAEYLMITHLNGQPYDKEDCDTWLPSGEVFSVTVGLFANPCDENEQGPVPAYLAWEDYIYIDHDAFYSLVSETWPISQTSKTFTNLQFGIDNGCSNIESPYGKDSYYDWWCNALEAYMYYDWTYYDDGPLNFRGGEPGQQAYGITFSGTTNSQFHVSWLKHGAATATGEGSLLVIKQGSSVNVFPSDGVVYEDALMGVTTVDFATEGHDIGSSNNALYYQLDCACDEDFRPRAVTVTGLNANTTYYARVFELRYDKEYVDYGDFGGAEIPQEHEDEGGYCEYQAERFKHQEIVVKYKTITGTGNPRSKKTSSMEGMFAGLELIDFDGRSFERKVELVWATASEGGSLGFEIYRADAETFEFVKIANVAGNVNGSTYKLLDDDSRLEVGKTYVYRLSYIAKDGTIEDLSEITVPILSMPNSMQSIYVSQVTPNPVTDFGKLTVEMTTEQNLRIEVRNAAGQLVSVLSDQVRGAGVHNFNIDLTNRASGSYSILISTDYEAIYVPFMYVK